jgi:ATP-dependent RNA helicase DeaD
MSANELIDNERKDEDQNETAGFETLGLAEPVFRAIKDLGFEIPSKIQEKAIPVLLEGHDLIGQAQTGTGKTAAFGLPLLSKLDVEQKSVQALILTPTRELAIQISEALQSFAKYLPGFHILPIYGGASYETQIKSLKRGAHVVVGTPGRVMDLMRREKLILDELKALVLDEADEMLNMGFIEDIEWILEECPEQKQIALFSATMPNDIKRVARQYLTEPVEVRIAAKTATASTVRQRFWYVSGFHKIEALSRLLEVEPYDAVLIFVKTKNDAEEVSTRLCARGYAAESLHGDIPQKIREKIVDKLKGGQLDILVATDVAARGLDVDRITHVVNYDIPYDVESYVHRIGRTGRAGRTGDAILFVSPRDRKMLRIIEQVTKQKIEPMLMPTNEDINKHRIESFKNKILEGMETEGLEPYQELISEILSDDSVDPVELCAALAKMVNGNEPLFLDTSEEEPEQREISDDENSPRRRDREKRPVSAEAEMLKDFPEIAMKRYMVDVGRFHGVKPGQIVGAIANEGGLESKYIGHIDIYGSYSTVDLPEIPSEIMSVLRNARVCGRKLDIKIFDLERAEKESSRSSRRKPIFVDFDGRGDRKSRSGSKNYQNSHSMRDRGHSHRGARGR